MRPTYDMNELKVVTTTPDGGTVDVAAWAPAATPVTTGGPFFLQGGYKMVQRWIMNFLTEVGSVRYTLGRPHPPGTTFMRSLRQGMLMTEADVFAQFMLARHAMRATMRAEEHADTPFEERYKDAYLNKVILSPGFMTLAVTIKGVKDSYQIKLPIAV